jgi:hypothetical protein
MGLSPVSGDSLEYPTLTLRAPSTKYGDTGRCMPHAASPASSLFGNVVECVKPKAQQLRLEEAASRVESSEDI